MTGEASRTALAAALMRALHTRFDRPALIDDPWGERLVSQAEQQALVAAQLARLDPAERTRIEALGSTAAMLHALLRTNPFYAGVIRRTRYSEDVLAAAVGRGVQQYLILGAGMDSFVLRRPAFAAALEIFEVDHPATQADKCARIAACGASVSDRVHFVAADLAVEPLAAALARTPFRVDVATFVSWLGVTAYLPREANLATLRAIAEVTPPGSELVFTYLDAREFTDASRTPTLDGVRATVASLGEPMVSGFDPGLLGQELAAVGLELIDDRGSGGPGHIAHARTAPR